VQMKVIAGALAAGIAGVGGGMFALSQTTFQPSEFATFEGVVWLAVLVTIGIRSNAAALLGGVSLALLPALTQNYLPTWTSNVTPVLFGFGAVSAAKYPDGVLAEQSRRLRRLVLHLRPQQEDAETPDLSLATAGVGQVPATRVAEHIS